MSNFRKQVEKKPTNLIEVVTAGAAVKTAIDINHMKSEISELKKIEIQRSRDEGREREEAKIHRARQRREQLEHQARVEEDLQRRAEADALEAEYQQKERTLAEIEEIQSLGLGIRHDHYEIVKDIAIQRGISRQDAAKHFREGLIKRNLGALLLNDLIPHDQNIEAIKTNYPQLGNDEEEIISYLQEFLTSGFTLSEGYESVLLRHKSFAERQKAIRDRKDLDHRMFADSRNAAPGMLNSINVSLGKMKNIENSVIAHIDQVQGQIDKRILISHAVTFLLGVISLTALFFNDNWKYGLVMGIIVGLFMNWVLHTYITGSKNSQSSFVNPDWLGGCSSNLKSHLSKPGGTVEDIRMGAPSMHSRETEEYDAFLKELIDDLRSCSDEAFVFAVRYVLPKSPIDQSQYHYILTRNTPSFSKERALYLMSKNPSSHPCFACAQKYGWEFLYLLKQHVPDLFSEDLPYSDEDIGSEDDILENLYYKICDDYSTQLAERLFWLYERFTYLSDEKPS